VQTVGGTGGRRRASAQIGRRLLSLATKLCTLAPAASASAAAPASSTAAGTIATAASGRCRSVRSRVGGELIDGGARVRLDEAVDKVLVQQPCHLAEQHGRLPVVERDDHVEAVPAGELVELGLLLGGE
jgi:hypothetical protein